MPDIHKLRLRIEYDVLYVADLRKIVGTFESAYNVLQKAEEPSGRMRRRDRLSVQTVRTENPLIWIALGGIGLAKLGLLIATRAGLWKSEKIKWEAKSAKWAAKSAELDYEEKVRRVKEEKIAQVEARLDREGGPEAKAVKLVEKVIVMVGKSKEITSIEVEIDGQDTDPHNPSPLIKPVPKNQLGPLIIRSGRKFRS